MQTIETIRKSLSYVKPVSRNYIYTLLRRAGVGPVGIRKKPQIYPEDTPERLLRYLGLEDFPHGLTQAKEERMTASRARVLSLNEIKRRAKLAGRRGA